MKIIQFPKREKNYKDYYNKEIDLYWNVWNISPFLNVYDRIIGLTDEDIEYFREKECVKAYFLGKIKLALEDGKINRNQYRILEGFLDQAIDIIEYEINDPNYWSNFKREIDEIDKKEQTPEKEFVCQECGKEFIAPAGLVQNKKEELCEECLIKNIFNLLIQLSTKNCKKPLKV